MKKIATIYLAVFLFSFTTFSNAEVLIIRDQKPIKVEVIDSQESESTASTQKSNEGISPFSADMNNQDRRRVFIQANMGASTATRGAQNARFSVFKLSGGMDINKRFAVEAGAVNFSNVLEYDKSAKYVALVVKYPLQQRITVLGKVGLSSWETTEYFLASRRVGTEGISAILSAELEYKLHNNVSVTLGVDYFGGLLESPITAGIKIIY